MYFRDEHSSETHFAVILKKFELRREYSLEPPHHSAIPSPLSPIYTFTVYKKYTHYYVMMCGKL